MPFNLIRAGSILAALCFVAPLVAPSQAGEAAPRHAIAMQGEPALAPDFTHLPYANPQAPKGGKISLAYQGTFDSLNPFNLKALSTAQGLNGNIFQTLMMRSLDEPFTLYPLVAQLIETDEERSYVTFRLDPKAHFSDGAPLTADDVLFSFDLLKARGRPQQRDAYRRVKSITRVDDRTLRYELPGGGERELPLNLALMPVLAKHATNVAKFDETTLDVPTGSGPYKIAEVRPGERLVLKRDPDYWGKHLAVAQGQANFDEIRIDYYRDANGMFEAFKAGLVDYRYETDPTRWQRAYDFPALNEGRIVREQVAFRLPKGMDGFAFNTRRPPFDDVRVREALGLMFDFEWINANIYGGLYRRSRSFFDDSDLSSAGRPADARERALLATFPGAVRDDILEGRWTPPVSDGSGRDRDTARRALKLLGEAGYALRDGVMARSRDGAPLAFEIVVNDRSTERLSLNFSESLRRIGVAAKVRTVDDVQYQRRRQHFDFDVTVATWVATPSPGNEQRSRWGSAAAAQDGSFNWTGARNPAADAMIEAIIAARGRDDFVAAVRAFDRVLLSNFYIVPLFYSPQQWIARSASLKRTADAPMFGVLPAANSWLDYWWREP